MKKVLFLGSKKNRISDKINKFSLLKFLIWSKNKTTFCCYYNIVIKNLFSLVFIKFRNLLIVFAILDCINRNINNCILLF